MQITPRTSIIGVQVTITQVNVLENILDQPKSNTSPGLGVSIHKVNKRNAGSAPINAASLNFTHGVASGDPYPNSVIIWTRLAPIQTQVDDNSTVSGYVPLYNPVPIQGNSTPVSNAPISVTYKVAKDKALSQVVDSGTAYTSSDVDYTLKVNEMPRPNLLPPLTRLRSRPNI